MSGEKEYQPDGLLGSHPWVEYESRRIQKNLPTWPKAVDLKMLYPRADRELVLAIESKSDLTARQKTYLRHWALAYLEYCRRSKQLPEEDQSRLAFLERMGLKGRSPFVIQQADRAVRLLRKTITGTPHPAGKSGEDGRGRKEIRDGHEDREVWTRVLERVGREVRIRHYSAKTLKTYMHWIRGFALFLDFRDPTDLKAGEVKSYLEYLAVERRIAASTQNQAFNALLFLFNNVLGMDLEELSDTPRAKKNGYVPEVFSKEEVERIFHALEYPYDVFAQLLYGCGLRLGEGLNLRIQDLDFPMRRITVHRGKGGKSRRLMIPNRLIPALKEHLDKVRRIFERDLEDGTSGVFLPDALERKLPRAAREWPWFWVFPGKEGIPKRATAHTFRHSYATHLLQMGVDIRTVKDWMGHEDVKTTQIYTQALQTLHDSPSNPLDWQGGTGAGRL